MVGAQEGSIDRLRERACRVHGEDEGGGFVGGNLYGHCCGFEHFSIFRCIQECLSAGLIINQQVFHDTGAAVIEASEIKDPVSLSRLVVDAHYDPYWCVGQAQIGGMALVLLSAQVVLIAREERFNVELSVLVGGEIKVVCEIEFCGGGCYLRVR